MTTYYRNEMLFSEIYLEEITRQVEHAEVLASLNVLTQYRDYADTRSLQSWKDSYVHEVLSALGFFAKPHTESLTYLFPMGSAGNEAPLSLCYILLPDEDLDSTRMGRNWAEKTIRALRQHNLQWGLLTNGRQWRIYHLDEPTPYETYLEIDLEAILTDKAREAYQIFHKFMKAENFILQEDGKCQFDRFKKESQEKIDYIEKELANALKQREEGGKGVLSDLCMGYVESLRTSPDLGSGGEGINLDDEAVRKKIYHGAMLYMFRLLFLFYADARSLLSDENHARLRQVIETSQRLRQTGGGSPQAAGLWEDLESIFVDIDQTYNGGLFSPQESEFTRFLSETRINDAYLANVVYHLAIYREKRGEEKPISYRDMSVRHLGTLYEGLLEHKLYIALEDTEVRVAKGKIQFIPTSQGGRLVKGHYLKAGEVYFAGDPHERKSSGSYFTPEDVVDYIVRSTVGEKLKELKEAFLQEHGQTLEACQRAVSQDERAALVALLEENARTFVRERVLTLSVLDPAMGSGHFLVNAANLIANAITEILNEPEIETSLESSAAYWRRWVVENCLYGVDLNPLAVELAKLSLWILSMVKNQPLSFLNHHLKCGNSLVGARLEEIGNYPFSKAKNEARQLNLFERDPDFKAAVEEVLAKSRLIAGKASASLEDVRAKKAWLEEIDQRLATYKAICSVHTALLFDNMTVNQDQYGNLVENKNFILANSLPAHSLDKKYKFFHWELEFPIILLLNIGFDCVIGNPPYVEISTLEYPLKNHEMIECGNLYAVFLELAIRVSNSSGLFGMVVPISIVSTDRMRKLQNLILNMSSIITFSNFAVRPATLFEDVDMNITIVTGKKGMSVAKKIVQSTSYIRWFPLERAELFRNITYANCTAFVIPGRIPKLGNSTETKILTKLRNKKTILANFIDENNGRTLYYHSGGRYWRKAILEKLSTEYKALKIRREYFDVVLALLNSSLFYWYWIVFSDCYHVVKGDVLNFPIDCGEFSTDQIRIFTSLTSKLLFEYETNSIVARGRNGNSVGQKQYFPAKSKATIDLIDSLFADYYKFSSDEASYIINFDKRFRGLDIE